MNKNAGRGITKEESNKYSITVRQYW